VRGQNSTRLCRLSCLFGLIPLWNQSDKPFEHIGRGQIRPSSRAWVRFPGRMPRSENYGEREFTLKTEFKRVLRQYRRQPDELLTALSSTPTAKLLSTFVELFTAGELRLHSRKRKRSLCPRFYRYHKTNPHVADWFLCAAQSLKREQHREHYGIGALLEKIRFDAQVGVIKTDGFRICNDFQSCYARLVLMRDASLCGLFTIKPSDSDALVVDGRSWTDFAREHETELWPERAAQKKTAHSADAAPLFGDERSAS